MGRSPSRRVHLRAETGSSARLENKGVFSLLRRRVQNGQFACKMVNTGSQGWRLGRVRRGAGEGHVLQACWQFAHLFLCRRQIDRSRCCSGCFHRRAGSRCTRVEDQPTAPVRTGAATPDGAVIECELGAGRTKMRRRAHRRTGGFAYPLRFRKAV